MYVVTAQLHSVLPTDVNDAGILSFRQLQHFSYRMPSLWRPYLTSHLEKRKELFFEERFNLVIESHREISEQQLGSGSVLEGPHWSFFMALPFIIPFKTLTKQVFLSFVSFFYSLKTAFYKGI